MNNLKKILIIIISVGAILYGMFLFVLPNVVNLNAYKSDIQKLVLENAKLDIDAENIKLVTTPGLRVGVLIDGLNIGFPGAGNFLRVGSGEIKIKLLPLIFRTVELSDVRIAEPNLSVVMLENNHLDIVDFVNQNFVSGSQPSEPAALPVVISTKLPKVEVLDYEFNIKDKKTNNTIIMKGSSFVLDKAVVDKHFRVATDGQILVNNAENINFAIKADSVWPVVSANSSEINENTEISDMNFVNEFVKFDLKGVAAADLKIRDSKDGLKIDGFLNIDKMSAKLDSHRLPESFLHLFFKGHSINIDSDLYISEIEKAEINADITNSKKFYADLNIKTDKISFSSIQKFVSSFLNSFNFKNEINNFSVTGYIQSDFNLKTDLKKFKSDGYFKAINGSIIHDSMPVSFKAISADIDFSNNNVNIKNAGALVNGAKFLANGKIDSNSNADISIVSAAIPLKSIFTVAAPMDMKRVYDLQSGNLTINALIKGKLAEIEPKLSLNLSGLKIKDKVNGYYFINNRTVADIVAKDNSFKGCVTVSDAGVALLNPKFNVDIPSAKINIDAQNIVIDPFDVMVESSPVKVSGDIGNYMKARKINISAKGAVDSSDLKKVLPSELKSLVSSEGNLPLNILVSGDDKIVDIKVQVKADAKNHFSPVTIKKILNKTGLLNLALSLKGNSLHINDLGLYSMSRSYSDDFKKNLNGAEEIASVSGEISDLGAGVIKKIDMIIPEPLVLSTSLMPQSTLKARGRLNVSGKMADPKIKGFFEIKEVKVPEYLTSIDLINVNFNDAIINADIQNLSINGSPLNIKADASTKFNKIFIINSMEVTSLLIDADKIFKAMEAIPASAPAQQGGKNSQNSLMFPVKIVKGHGVIEKFKSGTINASNASGDFSMSNDTIKITNLKASAFGGNFWGDVNYNLANTAVKADVHGKSMDSNAAVTALAAIKDQVKGSLEFDADVTLKGTTYNEQMKTLKGSAKFKVNDGQLGSLGRFETFIQANNLLAQKFVQSQIGAIVDAVAPYNTGKFSYLSGKMTFNNGIANITAIESSGPHMSLMISGSYNLVNNHSTLEILGSLSSDVTDALGPVSQLSVDKIAAYIPKFGSTISSVLSNYNLKVSESLLAKIPELTPNQENTKAFKVFLNGDMMNPPKAVKSFQWLNTAREMEDSEKSLLELLRPKTVEGEGEVIPVTKEEIKEEIKNQVNQIPEVKKIKENDAVKTFGAIYNLYKDSKSNSEKP